MAFLLPRVEKDKRAIYIYVDEVRADKAEVLSEEEIAECAYVTSTCLEHAINLIYTMRRHFKYVIVDLPTDYLGVALAYEINGLLSNFAYTTHFTDKPINAYCRKKIKEIMN